LARKVAQADPAVLYQFINGNDFLYKCDRISGQAWLAHGRVWYEVTNREAIK